MLFHGHYCLLSGTNFCNALFLHKHDMLLTLVAGCFQWLAFVSTVSGLVAHLVASLTLDSAGSGVMQCASVTQGTVSSISTVFSWGGSISPDDLLSSILLLVVIIVAVIVAVIVVVVVVGEGSSIIKLSFVIIGSLHRTVLGHLIH
ncbi:hypothetical protein Tco_1268056 [Tanacetum coccineum]